MVWKVKGVNYKALNQELLLLRMGSALKGGGCSCRKWGLMLQRMRNCFCKEWGPFLQRVVGYSCREWELCLQRVKSVPAEAAEELLQSFRLYSKQEGKGGLQSLIYVIERPFQLLIRGRLHRVRGGSERSDRSFLVTCIFDRGSEITSLTHPQKEQMSRMKVICPQNKASSLPNFHTSGEVILSNQLCRQSSLPSRREANLKSNVPGLPTLILCSFLLRRGGYFKLPVSCPVAI